LRIAKIRIASPPPSPKEREPSYLKIDFKPSPLGGNYIQLDRFFIHPLIY
jgi:hypothetical protein